VRQRTAGLSVAFTFKNSIGLASDASCAAVAAGVAILQRCICWRFSSKLGNEAVCTLTERSDPVRQLTKPAARSIASSRTLCIKDFITLTFLAQTGTLVHKAELVSTLFPENMGL